MVFVVMRLLPGDPILMFVTSADMQSSSTEQVEALRRQHGLDRPLVIQYLDWLSKAIRGDMGQSILFHYSVADEIKARLPISLSLGFMALLVGVLVGPVIGAISAVKRGSWLD